VLAETSFVDVIHLPIGDICPFFSVISVRKFINEQIFTFFFII